MVGGIINSSSTHFQETRKKQVLKHYRVLSLIGMAYSATWVRAIGTPVPSHLTLPTSTIWRRSLPAQANFLRICTDKMVLWNIQCIKVLSRNCKESVFFRLAAATISTRSSNPIANPIAPTREAPAWLVCRWVVVLGNDFFAVRAHQTKFAFAGRSTRDLLEPVCSSQL